MTNSDLAYLILLTIALSASYFPIGVLQHYFFHNSNLSSLRKNWVIPFLTIAALSLATYLISLKTPDEELGNRIIHAFGGGFLVYLASFLAAKNSKLSISKANFFVFSFMLAMTLGVFNEVAEYFLQNYFDFTAAPHINDTWLDLISNIVGAIIAALCFTPFLNHKK